MKFLALALVGLVISVLAFLGWAEPGTGEERDLLIVALGLLLVIFGVREQRKQTHRSERSDHS